MCRLLTVTRSIMGNISCVSCNTCRADIKSSHSASSLEQRNKYSVSKSTAKSDQNNVANFNKQTADHQDISLSDKSYSPTVTSGLQIYEVLRDCEKPANATTHPAEPDVEHVAKAVVDINVFLASQVIFPAIERYMAEQQEANHRVNDVEPASTQM